MTKELPQPQEYTLLEKKYAHETLDKLGITLYLVQGWEFFSLILGNIEYFSNKDNGTWHCVCESGIFRSDIINVLLKNFGISWAKHTKPPGTMGQGLSLRQLSALVVEGVYEDGYFVLHGFDKPVNRLALLGNKGDFNEATLVKYLESALPEVSGLEDAEKRITIFLMQDDEAVTSNVYKYIEKERRRNTPPADIAAMVSVLFNPNRGQKLLHYSSPEKLFEKKQS